MADRDLLLSLDRHGPPLRAQIEGQLRSAIRAGRLRPGVALPSSRALAVELGVSRGVVVEAYAQLAAEGYLRTRQGAPTRVAQARGAHERVTLPAAVPRGPRFDFRPGGPDLSLFPRSAWLASLRRGLTGAPDARLDYGDARGAPELRTALAAYLGRVRGVESDANRVIVTSGMAQGMALVGRALVASGRRRIAVEEPWSGPGREQLRATGLEPVPVAVDDDGIRVDLLAASGASAAAVTPAHQFPLGAVLAPDRRFALVDWAERADAFVLEDDYDAEFRYDRQPIGAVQGLGPDRVVYAGSLSKTLAPGLRLGWLVAPPALVADVANAKLLDDLGTPVVDQLGLADFLERGELDRHLRRSRSVYRARRDTLVANLAGALPDCPVRGIAAGLHLVVELPAEADEGAVLEAARARDVGLSGVSEHAAQPHPPALLLGYGRISERALAPGVAALAGAVHASTPAAR